MSSARPSDRGLLPPAATVYALTGLIAVVYAVLAIRAGVRVSPDTTTYSRWADLLIAHDFNLTTYLNEHSFIVPPVLYLGWIVMVATLKSLLGESWMTAVVVLNWLALTLGVYATLRSVRAVTWSAAAVLLAGASFFVTGDLMIFLPFVLSDLIFWGMSAAVVAMGLRLIGDDEQQRRMSVWAGGTVLVAIALAFRPAALPLAGFWILALAVSFARDVAWRRLPLILGVAVLLAFAAIAAHAYVMVHPSAWPVGQLPGMLALLSTEYRDGVLVYAPGANLTVAPALDWIGAMRLTLQKLAYFATPWLPHYSPAHTAVNLLFFAPAYILSAMAVVNLRRLSPSQQRAAALIACYVLAVSVFHAMMQIDYDHRYRLPLLPALITLAAIGLESVRRPRTLATTAPTP